MRPEQLLKTLEGKRVHDVHCYCCGGDSAVLRQRYCKDELELFCDSCETWAGRRITIADAEIWIQRQRCELPLFDLYEARAALETWEAAHHGE